MIKLPQWKSRLNIFLLWKKCRITDFRTLNQARSKRIFLILIFLEVYYFIAKALKFTLRILKFFRKANLEKTADFFQNYQRKRNVFYLEISKYKLKSTNNKKRIIY